MENINYRVLKSGQVEIELDGERYVISQNRLAPEPDLKQLHHWAEIIQQHQHSSPEDYIPIEVNGVSCQFNTAGRKPTPKTLANQKYKIKEGLVPVAVEKLPNGARFIYYQEAKQIQEAERQCKAEMVAQLLQHDAKYPDLLGMPSQYPPLHNQGTWAAGKCGSAEALAVAAVDEAYNVGKAMNTTEYPSISTIAEFTKCPYSLLLQHYIDHHLNAPSETTNYIPYEEWIKE